MPCRYKQLAGDIQILAVCQLVGRRQANKLGVNVAERIHDSHSCRHWLPERFHSIAPTRREPCASNLLKHTAPNVFARRHNGIRDLRHGSKLFVDFDECGG